MQEEIEKHHFADIFLTLLGGCNNVVLQCCCNSYAMQKNMVFGFRNVVFISCRSNNLWWGTWPFSYQKMRSYCKSGCVYKKNRTYDLRISYVRFFNIVRSVYMQPYVRFGKIERIILSNRTIDFFEREAKKTSTTECRRFFLRGD